MSTLLSKLKGYLNDAFFVQLGHGAAGYGFIVTSLLFGINWHQLLWGWIALAGWTFPKEYVFDVLVEKETYAEGWIDQRSYIIGAAIATILFLFVGKVL